jgi:hypothetical protein
VRVIDPTAFGPDDVNYGRALLQEDGYALGWHVTSDPDAALRVLRAKGPLWSSEHNDLGPGFYVSAVPEFWLNRATRKWSFLTRLTRPQADALAAKLETTLREQRRRHYISEGELEYGLRTLENEPQFWAALGGQPYNIQFWQGLEELGIQPGEAPQLIELAVRAPLVRFDHVPSPEELATARGLADGCFTPAGWSTTPQAVLWHARGVDVLKVSAVQW